MPFTPKQQRAYRKKLRSLGICTRCHINKVKEGRSICSDCVKSIMKRKSDLFEKGLCVECMVPLDDVTKTRCVNCKDIDTERRHWNECDRNL